MSKTNCKSCGGPLNIADSKCPFCGTKNINLTDIDLASGEAANFIFKLPNNTTINGDMYMSMLAIPELTTISMDSERTEVYGGFGHTPLITYNNNYSLNLGLNLRAVSRPDNSICHLTKK